MVRAGLDLGAQGAGDQTEYIQTQFKSFKVACGKVSFDHDGAPQEDHYIMNGDVPSFRTPIISSQFDQCSIRSYLVYEEDNETPSPYFSEGADDGAFKTFYLDENYKNLKRTYYYRIKAYITGSDEVLTQDEVSKLDLICGIETFYYPETSNQG